MSEFDHQLWSTFFGGNISGRVIILLQQCIERGDLSTEDVSDILINYREQPEMIFHLLESMPFSNLEEVRFVAKADIETLRDQPVQLGQNSHIDGVTLTNSDNQTRHIRTCREYDEAIEQGYFAYSNFDIKMSTWFQHQCGLLSSLQAATTPSLSFIAEPRVSLLDLDLLPFSLFPNFEDADEEIDSSATYQSKVDDGTLVVTKTKQNLLQIENKNGIAQKLIEVARADFNGDGIEDILLFEYCYATHGTMGFGGICILTRATQDGKFEVLPTK